MIELEVQVLAHTREGLLMEIGRIVSASGFTLQRQRLVADPHGALLTLVVSGPARRQRALDNALGEHERVISFEIAPAEGAQMRPHFALTRRIDHPTTCRRRHRSPCRKLSLRRLPLNARCHQPSTHRRLRRSLRPSTPFRRFRAWSRA